MRAERRRAANARQIRRLWRTGGKQAEDFAKGAQAAVPSLFSPALARLGIRPVSRSHAVDNTTSARRAMACGQCLSLLCAPGASSPDPWRGSPAGKRTHLLFATSRGFLYDVLILACFSFASLEEVRPVASDAHDLVQLGEALVRLILDAGV